MDVVAGEDCYAESDLVGYGGVFVYVVFLGELLVLEFLYWVVIGEVE